LTPPAASKLVRRGRLETETRQIIKALPEGKSSSAQRQIQKMTGLPYGKFGNFSPTSPSPRACRRVSQKIEKDKKLKKNIIKLEKQINLSRMKT
jgi:hypothetical protein